MFYAVICALEKSRSLELRILPFSNSIGVLH